MDDDTKDAEVEGIPSQLTVSSIVDRQSTFIGQYSPLVSNGRLLFRVWDVTPRSLF